MKKTFKIVGFTSLGFLSTLLLIVLGYVLYVVCTYSRIEDNYKINIEGTSLNDVVSLDEEYTIVTQNLGFGAYSQDFTFFMDGGKESRARSKEDVIKNINEGLSKVQSLNPDFVFFQEIDLDSTRSFHVNQYDMVKDSFKNSSFACAINYDSAYLMYPFLEPHGDSLSSLVTASNFSITSSIRRSLPISKSFSKFLDLDRCFTVSRVGVENGKELVLINVHTSAYGGSDEIRDNQIKMIASVMEEEYNKGNYVICGGDFNHDFTGDSSQKLNGDDADFGWAQPFPIEFFASGFERCTNYKGNVFLPTCRNCDIPYVEGNFTIIVDGFITSPNVKCVEVENIYTSFTYSDHCPVKMIFTLQ